MYDWGYSDYCYYDAWNNLEIGNAENYILIGKGKNTKIFWLTSSHSSFTLEKRYFVITGLTEYNKYQLRWIIDDTHCNCCNTYINSKTYKYVTKTLSCSDRMISPDA